MTRALRLALAAFRASGRPLQREEFGLVDALVAAPDDPLAPTVVFANAATPAGIEHPAVERLLRGLAAAGFRAVAPELPRVRDGVVTTSTIDALVDVARRSEGRVAFLGASAGAGLTILAAADRRLTGRISAVGAIAPFASLREMLRLATTNCYLGQPLQAAPVVSEAMTRSLRESAQRDPGVECLLMNRDPHQFDLLYSRLQEQTRDLIDELSPLRSIARVMSPVELLVSPADAHCPPGEAYALARAGRDVRLTLTTGLTHVAPRLHPGGIFHLAGFIERTLRRAATAVPSRPLAPAAA
jgi:pimeloyl-ACP methyl ester carboxylesterase